MFWKPASTGLCHTDRASESSYRGHDACMPYAALDEAYHHHDSSAMADADRMRQDLLQVCSTPSCGYRTRGLSSVKSDSSLQCATDRATIVSIVCVRGNELH